MRTGYSESSRINEIEVDAKETMTQLSQFTVVLLVEYDVLAILYYEINTFKCVLHISFGHRVICLSLITCNL